jgi:secreted Zn-dependent insulinase-like peptidase
LCVIQYLELMRRKGVQKYIWKEVSEIEGIKFRYHEKPDPEAYVKKLVHRMHVSLSDSQALISLSFLM